MCKPLLDPVTKEKVRFIDVNAAGKAEMETQFHMDQVRQVVAHCSLLGRWPWAANLKTEGEAACRAVPALGNVLVAFWAPHCITILLQTLSTDC